MQMREIIIFIEKESLKVTMFSSFLFASKYEIDKRNFLNKSYNLLKFRYVSITLSLISLTSLVINYGFEPFSYMKSC